MRAAAALAQRVVAPAVPGELPVLPLHLRAHMVEHGGHVAHERDDQVGVERGRHLADLPSQEAQRDGHEPLEQRRERVPQRRLEVGGQRGHPRPHQRPPPQLVGLQIDHPASGDGGGGRDGEVHDLENHGVVGGHLDDLARVEAELLVVVENRVHVLDPQGVDRAVEHQPFAPRGAVAGAGAEGDGEHAVGPLVRRRVVLAVQLPHGHRLGIDDVRLHLVLPVLPQRVHLGQRAPQHLVRPRLAREGQPHDHEPVPHHHHLVQLGALKQEVVRGLQVHLRARFPHRCLHVLVVGCWQLDPREQVADDALE